MIIVAGGDSFIYGSELGDCKDQYSQRTFTALLSQGHDYNCVAWPGIGNDGIARRVIADIEAWLPEKPLVIVSWTFPGRYEFRFNYDTRQVSSPWYTINPWTIENDPAQIQKEFITKNDLILNDQIATIKRANKTGVADFAKTFYSHVGNSEYWEVYSTLKEITYLQNHLKANSIPYLFTCADNNFWYNYTTQHADALIHSLTEQIYRDQDNWFWFPAGTNPQDTQTPRGFYQWAVESKYSIGTTHPLEHAHQDAAQLMQGKFNELVKKSL